MNRSLVGREKRPGNLQHWLKIDSWNTVQARLDNVPQISRYIRSH